MRWPDFLVVGTARAGTSALHYYLRQHPGIFLPSQKEPCFFCFDESKPAYIHGRFAFAVTEKDKYLELFRHAKASQVTGEISTPYLYLCHQTIRSIQKHYGSEKLPSIIIILRHPAERAYSQYLWKVRDGREPLSFMEALHAEEQRIKENFSFDYHYARRGLYFEAVNEYLRVFSRVKIIRHDMLKAYPRETLEDICRFIGADSSFKFNTGIIENISVLPRSGALIRMMTAENPLKYKILRMLPDSVRSKIKRQMLKWNSSGPPPPMPKDARSFLDEYYRIDLHKLQTLPGVDLSTWDIS